MSLERTLKTATTIGLVALTLGTVGCGMEEGRTRIRIPKAEEIRAEGVPLPSTPEEYFYFGNLRKGVEFLRGARDGQNNPIGNMLLVRERQCFGLKGTTYCFVDTNQDDHVDKFVMQGSSGNMHTGKPDRQISKLYHNIIDTTYRQLRQAGRAN